MVITNTFLLVKNMQIMFHFHALLCFLLLIEMEITKRHTSPSLINETYYSCCLALAAAVSETRHVISNEACTGFPSSGQQQAKTELRFTRQHTVAAGLRGQEGRER